MTSLERKGMTIATPASEQSLGEYLVECGVLERSDLERAERLRRDSGQRLNNVLTKLGLISERDMAQALAGYLSMAALGPDDFPDARLFDERLSPNFLKEARIVPISDTADGLVLA